MEDNSHFIKDLSVGELSDNCENKYLLRQFSDNSQTRKIFEKFSEVKFSKKSFFAANCFVLDMRAPLAYIVRARQPILVD